MPEIFDVSAGPWLRFQREAAGLTQEELADRAGLSVRAISNLERDRTRRPHPDSLRRIARSLDLTETASADLVLRYRAGRRTASPSASVPAQHQLVGDEEQPPASPGAGADGVVRGAVVPRQLPPAVASFAGRAGELAVLDQWLGGALGDPARAMVISAIGGMAGVGKTSLALQWAHRVADQFPDGQLYADLRGYDPGGQPAVPAELVRGFLHALGVAPERVPAAAEGQTALYRSVLAGRRMLIVADNARDAAQVRPLLPGTPGCVVIVTSRSRLSGLVAAEGARMLNLDVLSEADAVGLLAARLSRDRVAAEPTAVAELARLCGRLPLALAIVAARAALSGWPLAVLAEQVAGAEDRLEALVLEDPAADVRAVFSWSYGQLGREPARMFRLLAAHPGPDISVQASASLAEVPVPRAVALLGELAAASLAAERVPGRYSLHDLIRAYAAEQAGARHDADAERLAAVTAMLRHYLHTGMDAARALDPAQPPVPGPSGPGVSRERIADGHHALAWFDAEHTVLLAIIAQAAREGFDDYARRITGTIEPFLTRRSNWPELAATQQAALECSDRLGDPAAQASAHLHLGRALARLGQTETARAHLTRAAQLSATLGDRAEEARAHLGLSTLQPGGVVDTAASIASSQRALELAEAAADIQVIAHACNNLGYDHALAGEADLGLAYCRRGLDLCHQVDVDPCLEGYLEDSLGYVHRRLGDLPAAVTHYTRAVRIFRAISAPQLAARSLSDLGDCQADAGDVEAAVKSWQLGLSIIDDADHPAADQIRRKISELREAPPSISTGGFRLSCRDIAGQTAWSAARDRASVSAMFLFLSKSPRGLLVQVLLGLACIAIGLFTLTRIMLALGSVLIVWAAAVGISRWRARARERDDRASL
jgi:transcriptional regulator with XRE-family HTH domain/tetratricopeptide (TPR) repeat protein